MKKKEIINLVKFAVWLLQFSGKEKIPMMEILHCFNAQYRLGNLKASETRS